MVRPLCSTPSIRTLPKKILALGNSTCSMIPGHPSALMASDKTKNPLTSMTPDVDKHRKHP